MNNCLDKYNGIVIRYYGIAMTESIKSINKYKIYRKVKITVPNIIYQDKKSNVYGKKRMNKLQH